MTDCTVSLDESWQKRGHDSLNGVVTAINWVNDKVIDYHVMSKKCKLCQIWNKKKRSPEYDIWKTEHKCSINHKGSAGSMESAGDIEIFQWSMNNHNLRYNSYIGDGDSSSCNKVVQSKPYGKTFIINKLKCIGHIQKRLGRRLCTLRQTYKWKKLSDGKGIFGKSRLTERAINFLQNYSGMTIILKSDV